MNRITIEMRYRDVFSVETPGTRVHCVEGRIWITEERRPADIVLEAGESFALARAGRAVVQALRPARIALEQPVPAARLSLSVQPC